MIANEWIKDSLSSDYSNNKAVSVRYCLLLSPSCFKAEGFLTCSAIYLSVSTHLAQCRGRKMSVFGAHRLLLCVQGC